ncbi:MAG: hypothetical protein ACD_75C01930G0002, partial [uncultured bacterium]
MSGRLIHQVMSGEKNHRARIGPATMRAIGCVSASVMVAAMAMAGALHIDRQEPSRSVRVVFE